MTNVFKTGKSGYRAPIEGSLCEEMQGEVIVHKPRRSARNRYFCHSFRRGKPHLEFEFLALTILRCKFMLYNSHSPWHFVSLALLPGEWQRDTACPRKARGQLSLDNSVFHQRNDTKADGLRQITREMHEHTMTAPTGKATALSHGSHSR